MKSAGPQPCRGSWLCSPAPIPCSALSCSCTVTRRSHRGASEPSACQQHSALPAAAVQGPDSGTAESLVPLPSHDRRCRAPAELPGSASEGSGAGGALAWYCQGREVRRKRTTGVSGDTSSTAGLRGGERGGEEPGLRGVCVRTKGQSVHCLTTCPYSKITSEHLRITLPTPGTANNTKTSVDAS